MSDHVGADLSAIEARDWTNDCGATSNTDMSTDRENLEAAEHASDEWVARMVAEAPSIKPLVAETITEHADYLMAIARSWMTNGDQHHGQMLGSFVLAAQWWAAELDDLTLVRQERESLTETLGAAVRDREAALALVGQLQGQLDGAEALADQMRSQRDAYEIDRNWHRDALKTHTTELREAVGQLDEVRALHPRHTWHGHRGRRWLWRFMNEPIAYTDQFCPHCRVPWPCSTALAAAVLSDREGTQ